MPINAMLRKGLLSKGDVKVLEVLHKGGTVFIEPETTRGRKLLMVPYDERKPLSTTPELVFHASKKELANLDNWHAADLRLTYVKLEKAWAKLAAHHFSQKA